MQKKSRFIMIALAFTVAGGSYAAWHHFSAKEPASTASATAGKPGAPAGPALVQTRQIEETHFTNEITAVGSLIAGEAADIHAEIAGPIEKIYFEEGQPVKKGDILIQIDKSLIETELQRAKAADEVARATFNRDDKLKQQGFVSGQKWDLSKSELETAKSSVNNAAIRLEKTTIRAPFSGIVGLRNFSIGNYAETGQTLTSIVSIDPLKVEFNVPEKSYADIHNGQQISLSVDAWPNEKFSGTIYAIDPRVDVQTRNFTVKATVPNTDNKLRPGMYGRISIQLGGDQTAIMLPEETLIPQGSDNFVMKVVDGKATLTKVSIGLRREGQVEIKEGIQAGDSVITAGLQRVRDGAPVNAQPEEQNNKQEQDAQPAAGE